MMGHVKTRQFPCTVEDLRKLGGRSAEEPRGRYSRKPFTIKETTGSPYKVNRCTYGGKAVPRSYAEGQRLSKWGEYSLEDPRKSPRKLFTSTVLFGERGALQSASEACAGTWMGRVMNPFTVKRLWIGESGEHQHSLHRRRNAEVRRQTCERNPRKK